MADFLTTVYKTLGYEGGLVDDLSDPGGLTNYGIALNEHPELTADDIRTMTEPRAVGIYRQKYWHDLYAQIPLQILANELFDFGVTSGVGRAVETLQGVLFLHGGPALDGLFGPATLAAVQKAEPLPQPGGRASVTLVESFMVERIKFYFGLNKPQDLHSWVGRTIDGLL